MKLAAVSPAQRRLLLLALGAGCWIFDVACSSDPASPSLGAGFSGSAGLGASGSSAGGNGGGVAGSSPTAGSQLVGEAGAGGEEPGGPLRVTRTRAEYRVDPLGLDVPKPRLDWLLESTARAERQSAYQVLVARSADALSQNKGDLWDSGKVPTDQSVQVEYGGGALAARGQAFWKVRVWDKDDVPSAYSKPALWEMGLLAESDWSAKWLAGKAPIDTAGVYWIWYAEGDPSVSAPAGDRFFRKSFTLQSIASVSAASCVLTADNSFKLYVNGTLIGSSDDWRQTPTFSIQSALVSGNNTIAIQATNAEAGPAGLLGQCRVDLASGAPIVASTDGSWKSANASAPNWQNAGFDDSAWTAAKQAAVLGSGPWGALSLGGGGGPAPYFRKAFTAKATPTRARVYATALGLYELSINGKRVGLDHFAPGWTDYNKRVQVQTYDVTSLVQAGDNAIGAILGDGWYQGKVGFLGRSARYGKDPAHLRVQLELDYADGSTQVVASDDTWKTKTGPIVSSDNLDGEVYDARLEMSGWDSAGFDDKAWGAARIVSDTRNLVGDVTAGVQVIQELPAKSVKPGGKGSYVFDLGQNMVGWVRLKASAPAGTAVTLKFAEVLNPDGTPYYANMRGAKATDQYTFKGVGTESYEPHFTFHGFRYVEVIGLPSAPALEAVTGVVAHSATPPTGTFATSSELVNQLQSNIVWGQKGNFVSVPTDCPQRDERLGWMGDALIFVRTATFNMDVASFFTKWTRDVDDGQTAAGAFGDVSPSVFQNGTPAWGDAGVIVPWTMYLAYADTRILQEHYPAMVRWIEYIKGVSTGNLWLDSRGSDYGDWLSINDDTDKAVLASAFYAHSVDLVAKTASVLHKDADAKKYRTLFDSIKAAFIATYVDDAGKVTSDSQTAYGLALRFNLLPDAKRQAAADLLDANVVRHQNHLSTGFVGVSHLLPALSGGNKLARAYQLLNNDTYPSWGYEIKKGATTIWERWDGIRENGDFQDPGMNSFNHYSFGSVGEWMYGTVTGIELDESRPGYKHFSVRPQPGGGLTSAKASLDSIHGTIVSDWKVTDGKLTLSVTIPVNTDATVYLPATGGVQLDGAAPPAAAADGGYELGSGTYIFTASAP